MFRFRPANFEAARKLFLSNLVHPSRHRTAGDALRDQNAEQDQEDGTADHPGVAVDICRFVGGCGGRSLVAMRLGHTSMIHPRVPLQQELSVGDSLPGVEKFRARAFQGMSKQCRFRIALVIAGYTLVASQGTSLSPRWQSGG